MEQNIKLTATLDNTQPMKAAKQVNNELDKMSAPRMMQAAKGALNKATGGVAGGTGDSNMARGIGGQTKAEGRDFAKQAQGLGGLVHVYATFAANIFAVSAAFGALSRAADTTNMIKGLDQLGASSGRALGSLSKQLVSVTDGAISLRDAMTSVALASSGGMANSAILRMGNVAKQASQALGIAMPDAMSRLSRGITKLEPELLDELGIMVRVDKASQVYAASIGKTANALTDFEKRQAFANAVLEQGEKKFGAIKIDANPYAKILASMENIAHTGLEIINKVLSPILSLLSSSPTALAVAMGSIAAILLKQALPAIGTFKESMAQAAEQAKQVAIIKSVEAQKGYQSAAKLQTRLLVDQAKKEFEIAKEAASNIADEKVAAVVAAEEQMKKISRTARGGKVTKDILNKPFHVEEDAIALDKLAAENKMKMAKAESLNNEARVASIGKTIAAQEGYAASIRANIAQEKIYEEQQIVATKALETHTQKIKASEAEYAKAALNRRSVVNTDRQTQIIANRAMIESASQNITAQAAQTGATKGFIAAWKEARIAVKDAQSGPKTSMIDVPVMINGKQAIDEMGKAVTTLESVTTPPMSKVRGGWVSLKAGISGATGALNTFMAFAGPWIQFIGLAIAGLTIFSGWMTTSAKESNAFGESLDTLNSSSENVSKTLDAISKKDIKDVISVESTQAKSNALNDLVSSLSDVLVKFDKLKAAQGGWDKFWDKWLFDPIGKGDADKLAKGLSTTVIDSLKLMENGPAKIAAKKALVEIFGDKVDFNNIDSLNASFKDLDEGKIRSKAVAVAEMFKNINRSIGNASSALVSFKTALEDVSKQADVISNSLVPKDDFSKLGVDLIKSASTMRAALDDPINGLTALRELAGNTKALSFLPPDMALRIGKSKDAWDDLATSIAQGQKDLAASNILMDKAAKSAKINKSMLTPTGSGRPVTLGTTILAKAQEAETGFGDGGAQKALDLEKQRNATIVERLKLLDAAAAKVIEDNKKVSQELAEVGYSNLAIGLNKALAEAAISSAKSYLDAIKSSGGFTAAMDAELSKQQIQLQINDIKARYNNTEKLVELSMSLDRNTAEAEVSRLNEMKRESRGLDPQGAIAKQLADAMINLEGLKKAQSTLKSGSAGVRNLAKQGSQKDASDVDISAAKHLQVILQQSFGKDSALAALVGQLEGAELNTKLGAVADKANIKKQSLSNEGKVLEGSTAELSNIQAINGMYNNTLQIKKEMLEQRKLSNKYDLEEVDIAKNIESAEIIISTLKGKRILSGKAYSEAERNLQAQLNALSGLRLEKETQLGILASKNLQERALGSQQLANIEDAKDKAHRQYVLDIKSAEDITNESKLNYYKEIGILSEAEFIKQSAAIKAAAEERKFQEEILNIKKAQAGEQDKIQAKIDAANASIKIKTDLEVSKGGSPDAIVSRVGTATEAENAILAQQTKLLLDNKTESDNILISKDAQNTATTQAIKLQNEHNAAVKEQNDRMKDMQEITESLATLFGEMGTNIGKASEALLKMAQTDKKYSKDREGIEADLLKTEEKRKELNDSGEGDARDYKKLNAEEASAKSKLATLDKKHTKDEIDNVGKLAGAGKKLFGEKTAAYKILDGVEKASAAMKFAIMAKELALELGLITATVAGEGVKTGATVAGEAVRNTAKIPGIFASFMSMMGPFGPPAAALAIAAFIGSAFGGGGGGEVDTTGMMAADMQALGSNQSYENGKIVEGTGGVFGDSSAKSESITKSLELIAETSVEGMSYSNRMVELLTDINEGIRKTAVSLYQIPGIAKGTLNQTVEGSSSGGNWLTGTTSSSTEVIDSGIKLVGTFMSLVNAGNNAAASIDAYSKVKRSSSSSGFLGLIGGGSSSSVSTEIDKLDSAVRKQIGGIFNNAAGIFEAQGEKLDRSATDVASILENVDISKIVSLKGLKGDDLTKALNSAISEIMDDAAMKLFPELGRFKKFNEGYSETVARVIDTHEKIGLAYASIGSKLTEVKTTDPKVAIANAEALATATTNYQNAQARFSKLQGETPSKLETISGHYDDYKSTLTDNVEGLLKVTAAEKELALAREALATATTVSEKDVSKFDISEALSEAADGTDKFLEKMASFKDNFLSAAEQLAPQQQALTDRMKELEVPVSITSEELKKLILGYEVTNQEQADHLVALLDLSDGYAKVRDSIDEVASAYGLGISNIEDLIKSVKDADAEGTGASMAATVLYGLESAMYNQGITAVSNMVLDTVIAPIITAAGNGTIAAYVMSAAFTDSANAAVAAATRMMEAFNNPEVKAMMGNLVSQLAPLFTTIGSYAPSAPIDPRAGKSGGSGGAKEEKNLELEEWEKLKKELVDLQDQGLTPAALLLKQSTALLSDRNRAKFEEIQLEKKLIQTKKDQKDFDLKYIDTIEAINQGTAKTNAQYTKLATTFLTLDDASKMGLNIEQIADGFKSLDTNTIYDFVMNLDDITTITPAAKLGILGIAQSLISMKNAAEQAKSSLEAKIYNALGNSESALAITRLAELQALDDSLRPRQKYLYALEDEANLKAKLKTAYDKEIGSMKDLIGKLKETSKTIKEYQNSLKLGDLSTLTPEQKYEEARKQAGALAEIIASKDPKVTMDDKIAAANKLPAAAEAVLTASRTLFASSSQYQDDYNTVQSYLSSVTEIIDSIVPEGEAQLAKMQFANDKLTGIDKSSAAILLELEGMPAKIEEARLASEISGSVASGTSASGAYFKSNPDVYTNYKKDNLGTSADQYAAIAYAITNIGEKPNVILDLGAAISIAEEKFGIKGVDRVALEANLTSRGIAFKARGGLANGLTMVGEEGPELLDFKTPARVYSNTASNQLLSNKELIEEMRKMREEIKQLRAEQKEQTGHIITSNYDASARSADKVADATQDAANTQLWAKRSGVKIA